MMIATWCIVLCYYFARLFCKRFNLGKVGRVWVELFAFMIIVSVVNVVLITPLVEYFGPYSSHVNWATAGGVFGLASGVCVYFAYGKSRT